MIRPLTVVRASAGSGKTHFLSGHLLSLVCAGECPSKVLASTFTRKAAGEMFQRVIKRLVEALTSDKKYEELINSLSNTPELNLTREDLYKVLRTVINTQHKLKIETLDSFFVSLGKAFFPDFSLPDNWQIADTWETARIEEDALERTMSSIGKEQTTLLLSLITESENPSLIRNFLLRQVNDLYNEFQSAPVKAWGKIDTSDKVYDLSRIEELLQYDSKEPINGEKPNANSFKQSKKILTLIKLEDWKEVLKNRFVSRILVSKDYSYYNKPVPEPLIEGIKDAGEIAKSKVLISLKEKSLALAAFLSEFDRHLMEISIERGLLSFRELLKCISSFAPGIEAKEVFYRIDSSISHLLLDEFQDTSPLQWRSLAPFAEELLSKADRFHSFLAVGDTKQAIYSWRGGTSELFEEITKEYPALLEASIELNKTYRCYPGIVDFVNLFFTNLDSNPALSDFPEARTKWQADFKPHEAHKTEKAGIVSVRSLPSPEEQDIETIRLNQLLTDINFLFKKNSDLEIGILTRTNTQVQRIERFLTDNEISVSGAGGQPISHSRFVQLIISLFSLSIHPDEKLSCAHLLDSPLRDKILSLSNTNDIMEISHNLNYQVKKYGHSFFLRKYINYLNPFFSATERTRASYLLSLTLGFERRGGNSTRDLLNIFKNSSLEQGKSSNVKVMTFHKSKGLEFDSVIIPYLEDPFFSANKLFLLKNQESQLQEPSLVLRNCPSDIRSYFPELSRMHNNWCESQVMEGLCINYVAFTRAIHSLYLYLEPSEKPLDNENNRPPSFSKLIRGVFGYVNELPSETVIYETSNPIPIKEKEISDKSENIKSEITLRETLTKDNIPEIPSKNLRRISPSLNSSSPVERLREARDHDQSGMSFGLLIHTLLQDLIWLDQDSEDIIEVIQNIAQNRSIDISNNKRLFGYLENAFNNSSIKSLFNPHSLSDKQSEELKVETELPFSLPYEGGILSGRIDRIVIRSTGQDKHCFIYDYKTGKDAKEELLLRQSKSYKYFAEKKYQIKPENITCQFVFLSTGQIKTI